MDKSLTMRGLLYFRREHSDIFTKLGESRAQPVSPSWPMSTKDGIVCQPDYSQTGTWQAWSSMVWCRGTKALTISLTVLIGTGTRAPTLRPTSAIRTVQEHWQSYSCNRQGTRAPAVRPTSAIRTVQEHWQSYSCNTHGTGALTVRLIAAVCKGTVYRYRSTGNVVMKSSTAATKWL
jgi:hypothetical protein